MSLRTREIAIVTAGALALAGCASQETAGERTEPSPTAPAGEAPTGSQTWEPWPPPERADVERPAATGEIAELTAPEGGMPIEDLLAFVTKRTGVAFVYDSSPQGKVKSVRVSWTGTLRVPTSRLLDLTRSLIVGYAVCMIPTGPRDGTESWLVLDMANALLKTHPITLREEEILGYGDCDGLFVTTTFRVRDTLETQKVRNLLTPFCTTTAGIGRVQDVPGSRTIAVADFAPAVAAMKRLVDEVNRNAEPPPYPPPLRNPTPAKPPATAETAK